MKPEDFVDVARELAVGPNEAHWRSALSRAYYGAFHVALRMLASFGVYFSKSAAAHEKVAFCLQNAGSAELNEAGRLLASLREMRNTADYRLDSALINPKLVATQLNRVDQVIAAIW